MSEYVKLATGAGRPVPDGPGRFPGAVPEDDDDVQLAAAQGACAAIPVPAFAADLPTAKEVVEANFAFASKLLKQQKDFTEKLVRGRPAPRAERVTLVVSRGSFSAVSSFSEDGTVA